MACAGAALVGAALGVYLWPSLSDGEEVPAPGGNAAGTPPTRSALEVPGDRIVFALGPPRPEHTPSLLSAETQRILCFYDLPDLPADTELKAYWWMNGDSLGEADGPAHPQSAAKHAAGHFILLAPDGESAFPEGIYEVELRAAGEKVERASFVATLGAEKTLSSEPTAVGQLKVVSCATARAVDEKGVPVQPSTSFTGTERIYVAFTYMHGTARAAFVVRWHFRDMLIEQATQRLVMSGGAGRAVGWMQAGEPLPPGEYWVEVLRAGDQQQPLATAKFTVTAGEAPHTLARPAASLP